MDLWEIVTDLAGLGLVGGLFYRLGLIHGDMIEIRRRVFSLEKWRDAFGMVPKL